MRYSFFSRFSRFRQSTLLSIVVASLCFTSCEQIFEPIGDEEKRLAVSATFSPLVDVANPGLGFLVFLSPIVPFSEVPNNALISDAEVDLFEGNHHLESFITGKIGNRNVYASFTQPEIGKLYTLQIYHPDYGYVEASDRLPSLIEARINGFENLVYTDLPEGKRKVVFTLDVQLKDRPIEDNYYHLFIEYRLESDPGFRRFFQVTNAENNDPAITPYLLNQSILLDGRLFNGELKTLRLTCQAELEPGEEIRNVQAEFRHASLHYYQFHRTQAIQVSNGGSPVIEPTPLYSNVIGGVGFFGGFNPTRDTIQLIE